MPFKVHLKNGMIVEADTAAEVRALTEVLGDKWEAVEHPPPTMVKARTIRKAHTSAAKGNEVHVPTSLGHRTLAFLYAIKKADKDGGAETSDLMSVVDAQDPRGVGAKVRPIKTVLEGMGLDPEDVFYVDREGPDEATWHAGPFIKVAIGELERFLNKS